MVEIGQQREVAADPLEVAEVLQRAVHSKEVFLAVDRARVGGQEIGAERHPRREVPVDHEPEVLAKTLEDVLSVRLAVLSGGRGVHF